jgi:hypothetical protein
LLVQIAKGRWEEFEGQGRVHVGTIDFISAQC